MRKTYIAVLERDDEADFWRYKVETFDGKLVRKGRIFPVDLNDAIDGVCYLSGIMRSEMCVYTRG